MWPPVASLQRTLQRMRRKVNLSRGQGTERAEWHREEEEEKQMKLYREGEREGVTVAGHLPTLNEHLKASGRAGIPLSCHPLLPLLLCFPPPSASHSNAPDAMGPQIHIGPGVHLGPGAPLGRRLQSCEAAVPWCPCWWVVPCQV